MNTVKRSSSIIVLAFVIFCANLAVAQAQSADQYRVYLPILGKPFMAGDRKIASADGMAQRFVPAGNFTMGSENGESNEQPVHTVYLDGYWIDETEVTNGMYARCVAAGGCTPPWSTESWKRPSYYGDAAFENYPVMYVDWFQSQAYCAWTGRELPTEAQWEKAARGTDARTYPWGEGIDCTYANYNDNYIYFLSYDSCTGNTTEVGSYPTGASPYGALDMGGNVWEWVADWYDDSYYATSPQINPTGPESGITRLLRGGSWFFNSNAMRAASRYFFPDLHNDTNIGFRCSQD